MSKQKFGLSVKKNENFSEWYTQVIVKGEILDYYNIKGCYILRPNGHFIWKTIQKWFTYEIEKLGVEECAFPLLIPKSFLEKEESHIADFSPEVAWITKCGDEVLHEPVAIRPTSETVLYPSFANWINSHRDLPLKLNQWCNVLRWELRGCTPLIRSKEIYWQEGHTAYAHKKDADDEVLVILDLYYKMYKDLLAVPVIKGIKSESEKFAGADYTTTIEGFIPHAGKGIQAATSHSLGQNFSKIFDIKVQLPDETIDYVWQNSWGLTTRSIGVCVMIHSDDKGLVIPPKVSKIQVVIVPCGLTSKTSEEDKKLLFERVNNIHKTLCHAGIRSHIDDREHVSIGYKFNYWEIRGVPLRLEIGQKELRNNKILVYRRHSGIKEEVDLVDEYIDVKINGIMNDVHNEMYERALRDQTNKIKYVVDISDLISKINDKCLVMVPWCKFEKCEEEIKIRTTEYKDGKVVLAGAKCLCIPFDTKQITNEKCVICKRDCKEFSLFGRSY